MDTTSKTAVRTPSATDLYWGERGHVACAIHAPFEGSDTWVWERWEPLPPEAVAGYAEAGCAARCEACGKEAAR